MVKRKGMLPPTQTKLHQGANDPRIKQVEFDQIVHAMQDANISVTYL
ncbi:MAG: hypothetical protein K8R25_00800 [Methanosarcinales archaeon]|nr:hypothetical protein [Methanosarcinales archaeon]